MGGSETPCPFPVYLYPDTVTVVPPDYSPAITYSLVGGAGDATLSDGLDTTYARFAYPSSSPPGGGHPWSGVYYTFPATTVPDGSTITSRNLVAKAQANASGTHLQYAVADDILDTYTPLHVEATGAAWTVSTSSFGWLWSAATWHSATNFINSMAAGTIQAYIMPYDLWTDGRTVDISEVFILVDGTCP